MAAIASSCVASIRGAAGGPDARPSRKCPTSRGKMLDEETQFDTDVLITGGGPVGLALAIDLSKRNVRTIVVEQLVNKGMQPRAKMINVRGMAHARRWGLTDAMRNAIPLTRDYPTNI